MLKTPIELAVAKLHKLGYQASPSSIYPGHIRVLDPVQSSRDGRTFKPEVIHHLDLWKFLDARS